MNLKTIEYVDEVIQQIRDFQYEELYQKEPLVECDKSGNKFKEILPRYVDVDDEKVMIHKEYYGRYIDRGTFTRLTRAGNHRGT